MGTSLTFDIISVKLNWSEEEEQFASSILSSLMVFGLMIGSFAAGPLLVYGRRRAMILSNIVMIIPVTLL